MFLNKNKLVKNFYWSILKILFEETLKHNFFYLIFCIYNNKKLPPLFKTFSNPNFVNIKNDLSQNIYFKTVSVSGWRRNSEFRNRRFEDDLHKFQRINRIIRKQPEVQSSLHINQVNTTIHHHLTKLLC